MFDTNREYKDEEVVRDIARAVKSVKFGYVQVIIQDSKVVQIDKTEKLRLGNFVKKHKEDV